MKIGNKQIIVSETMLVPDGDLVEIDASISKNEVLKLIVKCVNAEGSNEQKPIIRHEQVGDKLQLTFENFNSALGQITSSPTLFANSSLGEPITYFAAVYRWPAATKIELQIMLGARP